MDTIIFDIETKETFQETGSMDPRSLSLSLIGAYSYQFDQFQTYLEEEIAEFWRLLEKAELIVGYNSNHFDIPILAKYLPQITKIQSLDLHQEIQKTAGHRAKLDSIAQATLGLKKSANGLEAIQMYKEGQIEELKKYCLLDVKITRDIYEYGKKEGRVWCTNFPENKEIKVNFKPEIEKRQALDLSLGF